MIIKTNIKPNYCISNNEYKTMLEVLQQNPLHEHGIARRNNKKYKILTSLQKKGLIGRRGYKYYPTKHAWLLWLQFKEQSLKTQQTIPTNIGD